MLPAAPPALGGLGAEGRDLAARPLAEQLYHLLATSLLLAEGQALRDRDGSCRKLFAAALYARRWLEPTPPGAPVLTPAQLAGLDVLVDWEPVPPATLEAMTLAASA